MGQQHKAPLWWDGFITEYLKNGQNGKRAYWKVKPHVTEHTAEVESTKLLKNPKFLDLLKSAQEKAEKRNGMSLDRWLKILSDVAEFDIRQYLEVDDAGDTRLIENWKELANGHVLSDVNITTTESKFGTFRQVKLSRDSKLKALELIGKALGYLKDRVELSGNVDIGAQILAARNRARVDE